MARRKSDGCEKHGGSHTFQATGAPSPGSPVRGYWVAQQTRASVDGHFQHRQRTTDTCLRQHSATPFHVSRGYAALASLLITCLLHITAYAHPDTP